MAERRTKQNKLVDPVYNNYWEGGIEYVETEPGADTFMPSGRRVQVDPRTRKPILVKGKQVELETIAPGWNDDPAQVAADAAAQAEFETDYQGDPSMVPSGERADGSFQPGVFIENDDFYVKPVKPADADTAADDANGNSKYTTSVDEQSNTVWTVNPSYDPTKKLTTPIDTKAATDATEAAATAISDLNDAFAVVDDLVAAYGLDAELATFIKSEMGTAQSRTSIAMKIREQPAYKTRFPAMATRIKAKLPALTEFQYMQLERDYRTAMQAANLPATFSDKPDDFAELIAGDVSVAELQSRVGLAESALATANQDTVSQLQTLYDIPKGSLTAYFLDPGAAKNIFEQNRRFEAAGLSATAMNAGGLGTGLMRGTAEQLQNEDIAQAALAQAIDSRKGLTGELLGSAALSLDEIALGEFNMDAETSTKVRRQVETRTAGSRGRSGALFTGEGVTSLGEAT